MNETFIKDTATLGAKATGAEIIQIANVANLPGVPAEIPAALIRGDKPQIIPINDVLDAYRLLPARKNGTAKVETLTSFIDLTNRHKTTNSAIFAATEWRKPSLTSVINYHHTGDESGLADHLDHRIVYDFPLSQEWQAWKNKDGEVMSQADFAAFIEDRIADLAAPDEEETVDTAKLFATTVATPAKMVELSRGLAVHVDATVKQNTILQSGEGQITWVESHNGADGKPIQVPGLFIIRLAPFVGGEAVRIPVRLRYRVRGGSLVWSYQIYRPDLAISEVVTAAIAKVTQATNLPVYEGKPENTRGGE